MEEDIAKSALDHLMEAHVRALHQIEKKTLGKLHMHMCLGSIRRALKDIFGASSFIVSACSDRISELKKRGMTPEVFQQELAQLSALISNLERIGGASVLNAISFPSSPPTGRHIFIIHGHDELNTHRLRTILQDHFHLNPVLIFAKPGMSRPLIDKFEDEAVHCCFAIALCTPDDQVANSKERYEQARPNVIFEAGWFAGRLGRNHVLLLLKDGTRIHSDLEGVSRIQFQKSVEEKTIEIHRELQAARII